MHDDAMKERDEFDSLLDAALMTYVDAEARPGLTRRIISATSGTATSRSKATAGLMQWQPLAVTALAAAVLVAILLEHRAVSPRDTSPVIARRPAGTSGSVATATKSTEISGDGPDHNSSAAKAPGVLSGLTARLKPCPFEASGETSPYATCTPAGPGQSVARHQIKTSDLRPTSWPLPRRDVFPTPVPLTPEEQALMEANRSSSEAPAQMAQSATPSEQLVEPIHIAAIEIPPLNPPDKGGK